MMAKLTLRLEDALIDQAKAYAKRRGKSLSQVVADYFALLETDGPMIEHDLPPLTRALRGALRGADIDESDYRQHLEEKYL